MHEQLSAKKLVYLPAFEQERVAVRVRRGRHVSFLHKLFPFEDHIIGVQGRGRGVGLAERGQNCIEVSSRRRGLVVALVVLVDHFPKQILGTLNHGEIIGGTGVDVAIDEIAVGDVIRQ